MPRNQVTSIPLQEGTLVVVFEGLKKVTNGPHAGETTIGPIRIYLGTEQVGMFQRFKLETKTSEVLPSLEFDFGGSLEEGKSWDLFALKEELDYWIERITQFFPWAKWRSPFGSGPTPSEPFDVLDPGTIQPQTPSSGGGL